MAKEAEIEQHMAAVIGPEPAQFDALIFALTSSSNTHGGFAETWFNHCRARQPETGPLFADLGPDWQTPYDSKVLLAFANAMDDFNDPGFHAHAASMILTFGENCSPDILTPYLDGIVWILLLLLQNGKQTVQEGAITALASVADSWQGQFEKYYDVLMPHLKAILINTTDWPNRMFRAKCLECISLVGMTVDKDKFRDDAKQVMDVVFLQLAGSYRDHNDPFMSYMSRAWARICKCLGQDFVPYLGVVLDPLLQSAEPRCSDFMTPPDCDEESIQTVKICGVEIGIRTSVLEEAAEQALTACNRLCFYADELQEGFYSWVNHVADALVPLLTFLFHEEVKRAAVAAMPKLLNSMKKAIVKGQAQGYEDSCLEKLSGFIIPALVEALHQEPKTEIAAAMLESLNECMQLSGAILAEDPVRSIVDEIENVITDSAEAEDLDILIKAGKCLGTLIKIFKKSFLPFFDELSLYIIPMLGKDKTREERKIAICIFNDVAEQCHEAAHQYYGTFLPFLLEASNDEDANVRQAALYGIGVCAEYGGEVFRPLVGEALSKLNNVIRRQVAWDSENSVAYDNAVSTEKASMLLRSDIELLGPDNQYLPKIVSVFAEVLLCGKDLASEHTLSRMISLLRMMLSNTSSSLHLSI